MTSINPLYPDKLMGGAPRHLQQVAEYLSFSGHNVRILCTKRSDLPTEFKWPNGTTVLPQLILHHPFPQPYAIPPYSMAQNF